MAVILAHPAAAAAAGTARARRPASAARDIPLPLGRLPIAAAPRRRPSILLLGLLPLLLANASWDAVTFLGGRGLGSASLHAPTAPAHASACA